MQCQTFVLLQCVTTMYKFNVSNPCGLYYLWSKSTAEVSSQCLEFHIIADKLGDYLDTRIKKISYIGAISPNEVIESTYKHSKT